MEKIDTLFRQREAIEKELEAHAYEIIKFDNLVNSRDWDLECYDSNVELENKKKEVVIHVCNNREEGDSITCTLEEFVNPNLYYERIKKQYSIATQKRINKTLARDYAEYEHLKAKLGL